MDKKQTNERTDKITPISERNLAMMVIYLLSSLKKQHPRERKQHLRERTGHSVFELSPEIEMLMNR